MNGFKSTRSTWAAVVILGSAIFGGCGDDAPPADAVVRPIKILELSEGSDEQVLEFPGTVRAGRHAELAFEVAGKIETLPVTEGQAVEAGAVLATLDARDFQSKLAGEQAKERAAKAEYDRTKILFDENVASQQQLDVKLRNYEVTRNNLNRARKARQDTQIVAPFAGVVARVDVDNFENVAANQTILIIENDAVFEVEANVPEQDAARISPTLTLAEQTVRARPEIAISALDGRTFAARFTEFATTADPKTRTFPLTLAFDNPGDVNLATGMTATVRVHVPDDVANETGLLIPSVAVASNPSGEPIVWVVDSATMSASSRTVEVGSMSGDRILVTSGLNGSEWLAVSGVAFLYEGMIVSRAAN